MKTTNHDEIVLYALATSELFTFRSLQAVLDKFHAGKPLAQSFLEASNEQFKILVTEDDDDPSDLERIVKNLMSKEPQLPTALETEGYREVFALVQAFIMELYGPPPFRIAIEHLIGGPILKVLIKDDDIRFLWEFVKAEFSDSDFEFIVEVPHFSFDD